MKKQICVIGLGYIGLPTAAMFANNGYQVIGVDINEQIIKSLNEGKVIVEEPDLESFVQSALGCGNLVACSLPCKADVFIIAVPTPITADQKADMSCVIAAAEAIVPHLEKNNIVILESTSPPGTVENLLLPILRKSGLNIGQEVFVAYSPERVLPGEILTELVANDRIIGGINQKSAELAKELYQAFVQGEIVLTTTSTAEMCKLMENTFRDVNIALANELALICQNEGINVWKVIALCNKHPRVNLLQPGLGVGGHCLAVDPWFVVEKHSEIVKLIKQAREINDLMPLYVASQIKKLVGELPSPKITVLGATYKPDIDDMRESPSLKLIEKLLEAHCEVTVVDPHIKSHRLLRSLDEAASHSDLLILAVAHREFLDLDFQHIHHLMRTPVIFDTKNYWSLLGLESLGFKYYLLGNGSTSIT